MIATAVLAAQYAGTLDLSATTRIGARSSQPPPIVSLPTPGATGTDYIAADFSTAVAARCGLTDRHWTYSLAYSPSLNAADVELGFIPQALQTGSATVGWRNRSLQLSLSESGSYGRLNSAILFRQLAEVSPTTTPTQTPLTPQMGTAGAAMQLQPSAPQSGLEFGSTSTLGNLSLRVAPRVLVSLAGGYIASGGLNPEAKTFLPEAYGPLVVGSASYSLSRSDSFIMTASAQGTTTSGACQAQPNPGRTELCVEHAPLAELRGSIREQLSGSMGLTLSAGVAGYIIQTQTLEEGVIQPEGVVILTNRFGPAGTSFWTLSAALAPNVDIRTGLVSDRVQGTASLSEPFAPTLTLVLAAGVLQSVPFPADDPFPITALNGGIDVRVHVDRQVDVGVGVQELWQNQSGYATLLSTFGYVSVTARAQTLHF